MLKNYKAERKYRTYGYRSCIINIAYKTMETSRYKSSILVTTTDHSRPRGTAWTCGGETSKEIFTKESRQRGQRFLHYIRHYYYCCWLMFTCSSIIMSTFLFSTWRRYSNSSTCVFTLFVLFFVFFCNFKPPLGFPSA